MCVCVCVCPTFQRRKASRPSSSRPSNTDSTMIHHGTPPYWASRLSGKAVRLTCRAQTLVKHASCLAWQATCRVPYLCVSVLQKGVLVRAVQAQRGSHLHHCVMQFGIILVKSEVEKDLSFTIATLQIQHFKGPTWNI